MIPPSDRLRLIRAGIEAAARVADRRARIHAELADERENAGQRKEVHLGCQFEAERISREARSIDPASVKEE